MTSLPQNTQRRGHGLAHRRNLAGPARLVAEGLEAEVQASVETLGLLEATAEVLDTFQTYARLSTAAHLRPGLVPERVIDGALLDRFDALTRERERERQEVDTLRAEVQEAEADLADRLPPPGKAWLTTVFAAVAVTTLLVIGGAGSLVAIALNEFVLQGVFGHAAPAASLLASGAIALSLVAALVGTLITATLGTWGRVPVAAKVGFLVGDACFAASFLAVRMGAPGTSVWVQAAWSGFEFTLVAMVGVTTIVVGSYLKRAERLRRKYARIVGRIAKLKRDEAAAAARLIAVEADYDATALTVQEREEAPDELRTAMELAEITASVGVLKGIARNRQKAAEGTS